MPIYPKMTSKNTALLVIDIVNGCCSEKCEDSGITFKNIRAMVPQLKVFIENFRKTGCKIIFTNITPWTKKYLPQNIQLLYADPEAAYYSDDTSGFPEEFYIIKPAKKDIIVTKNRYDAFADPKFRKVLKNNGIKYLVVAGVFTDGCVLATICGGFQAGYNFVILKDMIETTDVKIRQELSEHLKKYTFPVMYGKTMTGREFLEKWQSAL